MERNRSPKISIVIPVCNAEKYLEQCISSVLDQTIADIEIICVNDGSTDRSLQIMNSFALKDPRITILSKKNSGYGNSVNLGIQNARGLYIGIVESDDFISKNMYATLWELSEKGTVDVVKGNFWDYYDWTVQKSAAVENKERHKMPDVDRSFTVREYPDILWGHPSIWSGIYRKEFLTENHISLKEVPGGGWVDNPFFFETLCCAKRIRWTKEPLYYYRKTNPNSSSNNQTDLTLPMRRMMDNLDVLKKHNYNDEDIQGFAYARALMYLCGLMEEKNYYKQIDIVRPYAQKLMCQINAEVIQKNFHLADQANYNRFRSPLKTMILPEQKKLLIYNWVPFDNPWRVGGGVTIYCYNLIETILQERPDIQVYFLSSGWAYDLSRTDCYIQKTENIFGERCRSFEIVNSPVPAAQYLLLNNPGRAFHNPTLKAIFSQFLTDYGPFQAVHFNNIEGLSLDIFDVKQDYPDTRFIYSIHNYVPFCITGFYYQRHNKCNCRLNHTTQDCIQCSKLEQKNDFSKELISRALAVTPTKKRMPVKKWLVELGLNSLDSMENPEDLIKFSKLAIAGLNRSMDVILAVSKKVGEIASTNGIRTDKMQVSYIGTRIAEHQIRCSVAPESPYFKIGYLGSDRYFEEKGYPFLMETLASIDEVDASHIDLILTTTNGNEKEMCNKLRKFHSVEIIKGYTHKDLKRLLFDVHLGIVPVLWEDNLPQIAIEMVAMGVPILCSSFGGASELCDSELFRFRGGDTEDLKAHLLTFVHNPELLQEYWKHHNGLVTMKTHWEDLENVFQIPKTQSLSLSLQQYALLLQENDFLYRNLLGTSNGIWNLEQSQQELVNIRSSVSYRVGRFITYIPRKIRGLFRCYREHGWSYTIHRIQIHLLKRV